ATTASAQTLTTDHPDYSPGSTVIITGTGFQPGETVSVQVTHNPTCCDDSTAPEHQPWFVTADASGNFVTTWLIPFALDEGGAPLIATAIGQSSNLTASAPFTDSNYFNTIDFQQAANECNGVTQPTAECPAALPMSWINGILNPNNSDYFEGLGTPQRILFTG